jgi:hypothetical protein
MHNCYDEDKVNKADFKDKRLCKAIINVCSVNVLVDRQIVNSILESIMSLEILDQQLLKAS